MANFLGKILPKQVSTTENFEVVLVRGPLEGGCFEQNGVRRMNRDTLSRFLGDIAYSAEEQSHIFSELDRGKTPIFDAKPVNGKIAKDYGFFE